MKRITRLNCLNCEGSYIIYIQIPLQIIIILTPPHIYIYTGKNVVVDGSLRDCDWYQTYLSTLKVRFPKMKLGEYSGVVV